MHAVLQRDAGCVAQNQPRVRAPRRFDRRIAAAIPEFLFAVGGIQTRGNSVRAAERDEEDIARRSAAACVFPGGVQVGNQRCGFRGAERDAFRNSLPNLPRIPERFGLRAQPGAHRVQRFVRHTRTKDALPPDAFGQQRLGGQRGFQRVAEHGGRRVGKVLIAQGIEKRRFIVHYKARIVQKRANFSAVQPGFSQVNVFFAQDRRMAASPRRFACSHARAVCGQRFRRENARLDARFLRRTLRKRVLRPIERDGLRKIQRAAVVLCNVRHAA